MSKYVAMSGDNIWHIAEEMIKQSRKEKEVTSEVNGIKIEVHPDDCVDHIVGQYFARKRILGDPDDPDPNMQREYQVIAKYLSRKGINFPNI